MAKRYDDAPRCYDGQEIWALMVGNCGTTDTLTEAQRTAASFRTMHDEVAKELAKIQIEMGEAWVGEAADAAKNPLQAFREMSATAGTNLEPSRTSFDDQSRTYLSAKGNINPIPKEPEQAGWWGRNTPFGTSQEELNEQWYGKHEANQRTYTEYVNASNTNATAIPQQYPKVDMSFSEPGDSRDAREGTSRTAGTPSVGGAGGTGGGVGGGSFGGGYSGPTSASSVPQVNAPAASATGPSGTGAYLPGSTSPSGYPGGTSSSGTPGAGGVGPGGVAAGGYGPGSFGSGGRNRSGSGAGGYGAVAGGFGPTGGGFGPTGGGAGGAGVAGGGAGGSSGGLGAGARAGAAGMGSGAGGSGGAAGGAAGARGGTGGMMGGGAGGGRGGDDDKEHQRRFIQDSDEWFRPERDEDGGILRDPLTGMPVVPPVIGE